MSVVGKSFKLGPKFLIFGIRPGGPPPPWRNIVRPWSSDKIVDRGDGKCTFLRYRW